VDDPQPPAQTARDVEVPGASHAEMASVNARLRALELEHLQLRTKYLQVQVQLLKLERGDGPDGDADVEVLEQQIAALRDRILDFDRS
jgi:hypothetical protein